MADTTNRRQTRSSQPAPPPPPEPVYCICREPDTPSRNMIACDSCGEWYHWDCVGLDEVIAQNIHIYICGSCQLATGRQTTRHPSLYTFADPSLPSTSQAYPDANYINSTIDPSFIIDPYPLPDEFGGGSSSSVGDQVSRGQPEWYTDSTPNAGYASFYPANPLSSSQHISQASVDASQQGFYSELDHAREYAFDQPAGDENDARLRQHQQQARLGKGTAGDTEWTEEEISKKRRKGSKAEQTSNDTPSKPRQQRKSSAKSISSNPVAHHSPPRNEDPASSQARKPSVGNSAGQHSPVVPIKSTPQVAKKPAVPAAPVKSSKEKEKEATEGLRKAGSTAIATVLKALLAEDRATAYAGELEELVWNAEDGGSVTGRRKYTDRMRSLRFNLSKEDRKALRSGIKEGTISPLELSKMSSNDLANPALQLLTQDAADTALRTRVLPETASQPLVVQNHKGVMEVSDSRLELQRQEEREQILQESERNKRKRESEADHHSAGLARKLENEGQQLQDLSSEDGRETVEKGSEDKHTKSSAKKQRNSSFSSNLETEDAIHNDLGSPSDSTRKLSSCSVSSPASSPTKGNPSAVVPPSPVKFSLDSIWGDKPPTTDKKREGSRTPPPAEDDLQNPHKDAFMVDDVDWVRSEDKDSLSPFRDELPARTEGGSGDDDLVLDFFVDDQAKDLEKKDGGAKKIEGVQEAPAISGPLEYEEKKSIDEADLNSIEKAWEGQINNPDAPSSGVLVARQVGGPCVPSDGWPTLLPSSSITFAGRVKTDSSRKYLMQTHLSPSKEVIVVSFEAKEGEAENKEAETSLMDFLSERDRDALINPYGLTSALPLFAARDLYILSLRQKDPMPEFLILLDSCKVPEVRTKDYLLGVFIRQKNSASTRSSTKKVVSPPPSALPSMAPGLTTPVADYSSAAIQSNAPVETSAALVHDAPAATMQMPIPMPMPTLPPGATPFPVPMPMPMPTLPLPMPPPTLPIPSVAAPPPTVQPAPLLTSDSIANLLASLQGVVKSPMPDIGTSVGPTISNQPAPPPNPSPAYPPPHSLGHQPWMPPPGYYPPPPPPPPSPPPSSSTAPVQYGATDSTYAPTGTPTPSYPTGGHTPSYTSSGGQTPSYASGPHPPLPPPGNHEPDKRSPVYGNGQSYPTGSRRVPQTNGSPPRDTWDQPSRGYSANSWDRQPPPPPMNSGYGQPPGGHSGHDSRQRDWGAPTAGPGRERGDGGWASRARGRRGGGRY
ncbi:F-box protein JEMMA and related proteins with JmjC, PHD, F-box and LRR domains [Phaffia rhodozyma]|uniref:Transcription factor BYE1 n=1 Tax=Phaffia rhodozyma TaxID=264483 RepID=A0A0F7SWR8_PHARH|nr:F-box protein JEMMA and related proteins with JmjC, PHD, F-box and LRR domains [Phaffia rhodozyma]